jgi:hypothetical protein
VAVGELRVGHRAGKDNQAGRATGDDDLRDGLRLVVMALLTVTVLAAMIGGEGHAH